MGFQGEHVSILKEYVSTQEITLLLCGHLPTSPNRREKWGTRHFRKAAKRRDLAHSGSERTAHLLGVNPFCFSCTSAV
jgi:hypothetical protein